MPTTAELANQLVAACQAGPDATTAMQDALYSADATSSEAMGPPGGDLMSHGLEAIKGKGQWWYENHDVHSMTVDGPFVNGDEFSVIFSMSATSKFGPMEGQQFDMREIGVYKTSEGKIVSETFHMPPMG